MRFLCRGRGTLPGLADATRASAAPSACSLCGMRSLDWRPVFDLPPPNTGVTGPFLSLLQKTHGGFPSLNSRERGVSPSPGACVLRGGRRGAQRSRCRSALLPAGAMLPGLGVWGATPSPQSSHGLRVPDAIPGAWDTPVNQTELCFCSSHSSRRHMSTGNKQNT